MPRIVKAGAVKCVTGGTNPAKYYDESDIVLITPDWRPEGYRNPYPLHYAGVAPCGHDAAGYENGLHDGFEAGFSAALKALKEL